MRLEAASGGLVTLRLHWQCGPRLLVPADSLVVLLFWKRITGERGVLVVCLVVWFLGWFVVWLVVWFLGWFVGLLNNSYLSLSFVLEGLVDGDLALFFPHPSFPTPPISLAMIRHSPSHWAPPISCGGPCSTPGPLFLQLFNFFLRLKFTARPSPPPPPPTPLHLKQTPQESSLLLQQGGLFARQGLHRDNSGLYAFMKLCNTHTLTCFRGRLLVHASDYLKCIVVDVIIHIWGFCKY